MKKAKTIVSKAKQRHTTNVSVPASKEKFRRLKYMNLKERVDLTKKLAHLEATKDIII